MKVYQVYFHYELCSDGCGMFGKESPLFSNIETARLYLDKAMSLAAEMHNTPNLNYWGEIPISGTLAEVNVEDTTPEEYVFPLTMPGVLEGSLYPEDDFNWEEYYYPEEACEEFTVDEAGGFINRDNWEYDEPINHGSTPVKDINECLERLIELNKLK